MWNNDRVFIQVDEAWWVADRASTSGEVHNDLIKILQRSTGHVMFHGATVQIVPLIVNQIEHSLLIAWLCVFQTFQILNDATQCYTEIAA